MLTTEPNVVTPSIRGIDQQNWSEIQGLNGLVPYQVGLQKRLPGKTLREIYPNEIGSIYVFYLVYGRFYTLVDFGSIQITPVTVPPLIPPALPPNQTVWWDDFSGYSPDGVISMIWGGGDWLDGIGICETIIEGYFDPFMGGGITPPQQQIQIVYIPGDTAPPVDPSTTPYWYPPGSADIILKQRLFSLWPPDGDETLPQNVSAVDEIKLYDYPLPASQTLVDSLFANEVPVGKLFPWYNLIVGRTPDLGSYDDKYSMGAPFQPHWNPALPWPPPQPITYYDIESTGAHGVES